MSGDDQWVLLAASCTAPKTCLFDDQWVLLAASCTSPKTCQMMISGCYLLLYIPEHMLDDDQ